MGEYSKKLSSKPGELSVHRERERERKNDFSFSLEKPSKWSWEWRNYNFFFSKNRICIVKFGIKMRVIEDEKFNKKLFVDLSIIVQVLDWTMGIFNKIEIWSRHIYCFSFWTTKGFLIFNQLRNKLIWIVELFVTSW